MAVPVFDKDNLISDVLLLAPQAAPLFMSIGMHCLGCAMASGETLEQACMVHGVNADMFIERLNAFVAETAEEEEVEAEA